MSRSEIPWTDDVWNPVRGCSMAPGSELGGCLNCWAARDAARKEFNPKLPAFRGYAAFKELGPRWTGKVDLIESKIYEPMSWAQPRTIFVNSMSDLMHEKLSSDEIVRVFQVMAKCQRHRFLILTKRSNRLNTLLRLFHWRNLGYSPEMKGAHYAKVLPGFQALGDLNYLPNVGVGVSIESEATAAARIPDLLATPAALRFVNYGPALEAVNLVRYLKTGRIGWVIIEGESGPQARPFNLVWARRAITACRRAGVPVFLKQIGSHPVGETSDLSYFCDMKDQGGKNPDEWPPDLRNVRELPKAA